MRRPRVKCALCGKRRVSPKGINRFQILQGHKLCLQLTWQPFQPICRECDEKLYQWMTNGLWEKI